VKPCEGDRPLKKQHKSVKALFKKVDNTEDGRHTKIEEEIFYPAVREIGTEKAEEQMQRMVEASQRRAA